MSRELDDDEGLAVSRAWLERFQALDPPDHVVREISHAGARFAEVAREAASHLAFDSDAQQFPRRLLDLAPDHLKR